MFLVFLLINPSLELCEVNSQDKENILENINKHKYTYKRNASVNEEIVDEESLIVIAEDKKRGR